MNKLYFGDNLDVLRSMPTECVDLIYLDPPFNSNADYNLLYGTKRGGPSQAQTHAFQDMWRWGPDAKRALDDTAKRHLQAGALLDALDRLFGGSDMMAYLAMMAVRLIEMHRVLKPTGSLYLHCDPTASHYLKIILDTVFSPRNFLNEITWKRTSAHNDGGRYGRIQDRLLFYSKTTNRTFKHVGGEYSEEQLARFKYIEGDRRYKAENLTAPHFSATRTIDWRGTHPGRDRQWRFSTSELERLWEEGRVLKRKDGRPRKDGLKEYLEECETPALQDIWTNIGRVGNTATERLGYPTQKPLALLKRIVEVSSNEGDLVLDPFCGCGTAIEAAHKLGRKWIGIDVTYLAVHVIEQRLLRSFGPGVAKAYEVLGRPRDAHDAKALAARDWLEFQKWAVFQIGGIPKEKPGPDGGIDGIIRYHRVGIEQPNRAIVSVKGGLNVGVDAIHKLKSVMDRENAELGVLVCLDRPTAAMRREALSKGLVGPPSRQVARVQIVTVDMLFERSPVELPGVLDPPEIVRAAPPPLVPKRPKKYRVEGQGELLLPLANASFAEEPKRYKGPRSIRPVDIEVTRAMKAKSDKRR